MRIITAVAAAAVLATTAVAGHSFAASTQPSKMQQCAAQWQDLKKAGKTNGQDYKTFSSACMKGTTTAPAATPAAPMANMPMPAAKPAMSSAKPAATVAKTSGGSNGGQNRMKQCAAQWDQMKATGKTNGMTYRQWSSQCLKTH